VRRAAAPFLPLLTLFCAACLAGPGTALGGGPIGRAPDLREGELLREPDSTRGIGFIFASNRRDLLEESRVELNAAARSFERIFGTRPDEANIRLTSDARQVQVTIRTGTRPASSFSIALEGGRTRLPESVGVATIVVLATSREWLLGATRELAPGDSSSAGWMERDVVPAWLRTGLLQNVAVHPLHEQWMVQLGRQRDALPRVSALFADDACGPACLAPYARIGAPGTSTAGDAVFSDDEDLDARRAQGRGRVPELEGRARYAASTYSLVQFMAMREGPAFMRALVAAALHGGDVRAALGRATSFTADPDDIDRQWRVWLATFAYQDRR